MMWLFTFEPRPWVFFFRILLNLKCTRVHGSHLHIFSQMATCGYDYLHNYRPETNMPDVDGFAIEF